MKILTVDVETYWDSEYTLSKLSPLEYVMDDRFELISAALKVNDRPTRIFFGDEAVSVLERLDWSQVAALGHNMSGFDAYVLAYRYNARPRMWMCTQAMARPIHGKTCGVSLAKLVEHYKLGVKNQTILMQTRGRRLADFTPAEVDAMRTYNGEDTDQCYALFQQLKPHYNASELWQIDALTRMRTEPKFELDAPLLEQTLSIERDRKLKSLLDLAKMIDPGDPDWNDEAAVAEAARAELASAPKFCALLEKLGVEPPMKPSPTDEDKMIPALAKTDEEFLALQEHDNPLVAAAARARLDVKSTLLETRIQKFLTAGRLAGGTLPIPLRYCGAYTTGRDSGEEYNPQNMNRIPRDEDGEIIPKLTNSLRLSLRAPEGQVVIVADQSGIELRVNHTLWKVPYSTALWRADPVADIYRASYAIKLGCAPEDITKVQRQASKIENLGLGFGMGADKYHATANLAGLKISLEQAGLDVADWRMRHQPIVDGWEICHEGLWNTKNGQEKALDPWGLTHTCREGIRLPSGRLIRYPDLHREKDKKTGRVEWWYGEGRHRARIYAGKIDENIVQALARDSVFDCALDFFKLTGLRPALRLHDELVYVVPEKDAVALLAALQGVMRTPPRWWPELVVWSEGDVAPTYGDAK